MELPGVVIGLSLFVRDCEFGHACTKGCNMLCKNVNDTVAGELLHTFYVWKALTLTRRAMAPT